MLWFGTVRILGMRMWGLCLSDYFCSFFFLLFSSPSTCSPPAPPVPISSRRGPIRACLSHSLPIQPSRSQPQDHPARQSRSSYTAWVWVFLYSLKWFNNSDSVNTSWGVIYFDVTSLTWAGRQSEWQRYSANVSPWHHNPDCDIGRPSRSP